MAKVSLLFVVLLFVAGAAAAQMPGFCNYPPTPDCGRIIYKIYVEVLDDQSDITVWQTACSATGDVLCQRVEHDCGEAFYYPGPPCPWGSYCTEEWAANCSSPKKRAARHLLPGTEMSENSPAACAGVIFTAELTRHQL